MSAPGDAGLDRYLRPAGVPAEIFVEPSREARFLLRRFGWLVSPKDGRGGAVSRLLRMAMVAPFTQMTFISFELQAFLFGVFHQTRIAKIGHFVFMAAVNFFLMAGLAQLSLAGHPAEHRAAPLALNGALIYAGALLAWYAAMAAAARLPLWFFGAAPVVLALYAGANVYYSLTFTLDEAARGFFTPTPLAYNPWLYMGLSAALIALSHAPEPKLPPRAVEGVEWRGVSEYILGPAGRPTTPRERVSRGLRTAMFLVWGALDEWWAAPRLLPYNVLMAMFSLGYAPETRRRLAARVERALASGNPALDYVGIGGGTFLRLPDGR